MGCFFISCSTKKTISTTSIVAKTDTVVSKNLESMPSSIDQTETSPQQAANDDYNKCFSIENGYEDFVYTDTLITRTEKGNFFKKVSISDSKFVWSCGRGHIEKIIDTVTCTKVVESYFDWETEEFIALLKTCGSYCWTNTIIPVNSDKPILYLSYSAIDFKKLNVVSIAEDYFIITNLRTQKEVKFPIDKIECIDNFSLFSVKEIKLEGNIISFTVKCKDGSTVSRNTEVSVINLLD